MHRHTAAFPAKHMGNLTNNLTAPIAADIGDGIFPYRSALVKYFGCYCFLLL
jgi:hypothetical protein